MKIAHVINPFKCNEDNPSYLYYAQPITFKSMYVSQLEAQKFDIDIKLYAINYPEDDEIIPEYFIKLPYLKKSTITEFPQIANNRKLPIIQEIFDSILKNIDADYIIYSNSDIGVQKHFYKIVRSIIKLNKKSFIINRRDNIPIFNKKERITEKDLDFIYKRKGERHPGKDCFIMHREILKKVNMDLMFTGYPPFGTTLYNTLKNINKDTYIYRNEFLTFHLGKDKAWKNKVKNPLWLKNIDISKKIINGHSFKSDYNIEITDRTTHDNRLKTNSNIEYFTELPTPELLSRNLPINEDITTFVINSRKTIASIIKGEDKRKLLIVGPCSIHNVDEAYEYAKLLKSELDYSQDKLFIIMRVYFEKPRTNIGWKGLINDPFLDGTYEITTGLHVSRELLIKIAKLKIPVATEFLDTFTPQYIGDLISWGSIGARTVESQVHRQLVSGLSIPIGFKNSTSGSISAALNSMKAAASSQAFYGINMVGKSCMIKTKGNDNTHIILRGSDNGPNYYLENVKEIPDNVKILIDCSHGNSNKNHEKQKLVVDYYINNYINNFKFIGLMLESNIIAGNQSIDTKPLKYGVSITDACICWDDTKNIIIKLYEKL